MRVLVTGSSGLIGAALSRRLANTGVDARAFDVRRDDRQDVRDAGALSAAMTGCDGVVHLAAVSRVAWGEADPATCYAVNVEGTANVLRAAAAQRRPPFVVFASSREVYGEMGAERVTEAAPLAPVNAYGRSKRMGEGLVHDASPGVRTAILRLSNVYGGREDHPDRAVPSLMAAALRGDVLRITGGATFFDFVHTDDVVRGIEAAMTRLTDGAASLPPVHLTTGLPTSLRQLAEGAIAQADSASIIDEAPPRTFDVTGFCGDPAAAERVLAWQASIGLDDGLSRVARGLRADGPLPPVEPPSALRVQP